MSSAKVRLTCISLTKSSPSLLRVPMGIPVGIRSNSAQPERFRPQQPLQQKPNRKRPAVDSDDKSEPENSADGLPPESYMRPMMPRMVNNVHAIRPNLMSKKNDGSGNSVTRAIAETAKLQQLVEMEKQRMKFAKELELKRMQCELSQLKNRRSGTNNSLFLRM